MLNRRNLLTSLIAAPLGLKIADVNTSTEWPKCEGDLSPLANWIAKQDLHRAQDAAHLEHMADYFDRVSHTADGRPKLAVARCSPAFCQWSAIALRQAADRIRSQDYAESLSQVPSDAHASLENGQMVLRYPTNKYLPTYIEHWPKGYTGDTDHFLWAEGHLVNLRNGQIYE